VLAFLAAAWIALDAILRLAPGVYADALRLPPGRRWAPELASSPRSRSDDDEGR
jgi:hypothetical protein